MRVAVIYRPRQTPPVDQLPAMIEGMAAWVERYRDRMDGPYFFVAGGGMGIIDVGDSDELQRILAEHPFTVFADVEIRPVVDADTALGTLREAFAARGPAG